MAIEILLLKLNPGDSYIGAFCLTLWVITSPLMKRSLVADHNIFYETNKFMKKPLGILSTPRDVSFKK